MANPQPENGTTDIANEIFDHLCMFRIPGEIRLIVDTVIRQTYGWHKTWDVISNSQFMRKTGLKKQNVERALKAALEHNIVIKSDDKIKFNKNYDQWLTFKKNVIQSGYIKTSSKAITKVIKSDDKTSSKAMDTKETTKQTTKQREKFFENFWAKYPKKTSKQEAHKAWLKIKPDDKMLEVILVALDKHKQSKQWVKNDGEFIPYPATWLNKRRWEDEVPEEIITRRYY